MNSTQDISNVLGWYAAISKGHEPRLYSYLGTDIPLGDLEATLDFKTWAKKILGINCYFTEEQTKRKFQLTVYCDRQSAVYKIANSSINFVISPIACLYHLNVSLNQKGKPILTKAIINVT